ncbi:MAG: hypothetical protein KC550_05995, partial [Nanoarchaeota archaeon]|nr:hypothetical protein [Nanoarchaeota archaeon]
MEEGKKKKKFLRTLGTAILVGIGLGNANANDKNKEVEAGTAKNGIKFEYVNSGQSLPEREKQKLENQFSNNNQIRQEGNPTQNVIQRDNPQNDEVNNAIRDRNKNGGPYPEGSYEEPISKEGLTYIKYNADKFVRTITPERNRIYNRLGGGKVSHSDIVDESGIIDFSALVPSRTYVIEKYAKKYNVNRKFFHTLAILETNYGFRNNTSEKGAESVMQVMPNTLKRFSENGDHYEAAANLILFLGDKFDIDVSYNSNMNDMEIAVIAAGYNSGEGTVENKSDKVFLLKNWYKETKEYIRLVLSVMKANKIKVATKIAKKD